MAFELASTEFLGPVDNPSTLESSSGIYVLLQELNQIFIVIDFGYASDLYSELVNEQTGEFLLSLKEGQLYAGFKYDSDESETGLALDNLQNWWDTTNDFFVQDLASCA